MRRTGQAKLIISATILLMFSLISRSINVAAETASTPSLIISQLKITSSNGQFITLYNSTDTTLDMSKFQLEYFNSYDLSKATSSRLISLSGTVPPHGYYMVNDSALLLCFQLTINSISLGLSSTAGYVGVVGFSQAGPGSAVTPTLHDYVGWTKTAAPGAKTLPANTNTFLQRLPINSSNHPLIASPGNGSWQTVQPDSLNPCKLTTTNLTPVASGLSQLLPPSEPPATIISLSADDTELTAADSPRMPPGNIGLMAPQVTELLPNPIDTGNDSTDEFIELYNPNSVSFDLTGLELQSGLKTLRNYKFPAGTTLPPKAFVAYYSEATGLSLSNTGSQVKLLDPFGNSISSSSVYEKAKDGISWGLAKGKWYWTTSVTPNAPNVIKQPVTAKKSKAATKAKSKKSTGTASSKTSKNDKTVSNNFYEEPSSTPIHFWALALIGGAALLYGVYEYRADLANRIYQLRQYLRARRIGRTEP